jgi:hypothetical protein
MSSSLADAHRDLSILRSIVEEQGQTIRLLRTQCLQNTFRLEVVEAWALLHPSQPHRQLRLHYPPLVNDHLFEVRARLRQRASERLLHRQQLEFLSSTQTNQCKLRVNEFSNG